MKRRRSPQEKKRLTYDRDHVTFGFHSGTSFRKGWRKKEAAAERAYRRAWNQATQEAAKADDPESLYPQGKVRRRRVKKASPPSVRELVETKRERRIRSHGRKARTAQAHAECLQQLFERLLDGILQIRDVESIESLRNLEEFVASEAERQGWHSKSVAEYLRRSRSWQLRLRKWRRDVLVRKRLRDENS